jgi:hypothetical protein
VCVVIIRHNFAFHSETRHACQTLPIAEFGANRLLCRAATQVYTRRCRQVPDPYPSQTFPKRRPLTSGDGNGAKDAAIGRRFFVACI